MILAFRKCHFSENSVTFHNMNQLFFWESDIFLKSATSYFKRVLWNEHTIGMSEIDMDPLKHF